MNFEIGYGAVGADIVELEIAHPCDVQAEKDEGNDERAQTYEEHDDGGLLFRLYAL